MEKKIVREKVKSSRWVRLGIADLLQEEEKKAEISFVALGVYDQSSTLNFEFIRRTSACVLPRY